MANALQTDHLGIPVAWEVPVSESLTEIANSSRIKGFIEFLKYLFFKRGLLSLPIQTLSLFVHSSSLRSLDDDTVSPPRNSNSSGDDEIPE